MKIDGYRIEPLVPSLWADFQDVVGRSGQSGCWCMYWLTAPGTFRQAAQGGATALNRAAFQARVSAGRPPGLIAYDDDSPVGWVRVLPRKELPGLERSRFFSTDLNVAGVWSLSCFVVRARWRRKGLTTVLTKAAISHARANGAATLEAYPTDTESRKPASAIYLGLASTFQRLGFVEVQRKSAEKPMMRLDLRT